MKKEFAIKRIVYRNDTKTMAPIEIIVKFVPFNK